MGVLITFLSWLVGHAIDGVKQVALMLKSAFIQVRGFLLAFVLVNAKSILLQGAIWLSVFLLLNQFLPQVFSIFGGVSSWLGITETVLDLCPDLLQGVFKVGWHSLAVEEAFKSGVKVFSAWLSGWAVYRTVQYLMIVRTFGVGRGFWSGFLRFLK